MEVYRDYRAIHDCSSAYFQELLNHYLSHIDGWERRWEMEDNFKRNAMQEDADIICIETPSIYFQKTEIKGVIWIWAYDTSIEIFNITPLIGNHLSPTEYNYILEVFDGEIIRRIAKDVDIEVRLSKPYFDMEDCIGREGLEALVRFSRTSNRSTGNTHHSDFKKWAHFIFIVFRQGRKLSADYLRGWLIEDGWSDDMANSLSLDYEYSIQLLSEYEDY